MTTDPTRITFVVGEHQLETIDADLTPGLGDEGADAVEAWAGIRGVAVFVLSEFCAYVMICV